MKASKEDINFLLGILFMTGEIIPVLSLLTFSTFLFQVTNEKKNALDFLKSQLEQIRVITMFSKKSSREMQQTRTNCKAFGDL